MESKIDWRKTAELVSGARLDRVGRLLDIRRREIVPRLAGIKGSAGNVFLSEEMGFAVQWRLGDGSTLTIYANLQRGAWTLPPVLLQQVKEAGRLIYEMAPGYDAALRSGVLPPWSAVVMLRDVRATQRPKP